MESSVDKYLRKYRDYRLWKYGCSLFPPRDPRKSVEHSRSNSYSRRHQSTMAMMATTRQLDRVLSRLSLSSILKKQQHCVNTPVVMSLSSMPNRDNSEKREVVTYLGLNNLRDNPNAIKTVSISFFPSSFLPSFLLSFDESIYFCSLHKIRLRYVSSLELNPLFPPHPHAEKTSRTWNRLFQRQNLRPWPQRPKSSGWRRTPPHLRRRPDPLRQTRPQTRLQ